ncbi:5-(carboxyamino)imidazole ribonucleotide synthase [Sandaracinus amylolyticus]|uniref:5-(carboxyamino)imidazole ribonucleotide synthase n=1 Tax=Sandaracinus amylolyticus TaxID=927083 RepID=UPI001F021815|nr:5-(carboxyamino)imidazole ribonucleotide synthase [Sandaracinus amylolyticus]
MSGTMRVGVLGAGQLGRMLALAGHPIGVRCVAYAQQPDEPACAVGEHVLGAWDDPAALDEFASRIDVATYEFENVPLEAVRRVGARVPLRPSIDALRVAADRIEEKTLFRKLGIDTPPFAAIDSEEDLRAAVATIGLPAVLKTRTMGYDGKGQRVLRTTQDVEGAFAALGSRPSILEGFVAFEREVSQLGVRAADGSIAFYPLAENVHRDGILRVSIAPARATPAIEQTARVYLRAILESLDYVGVLALELFQAGDRLLANEMAPRVHNTGHHTIEAAETSQFENHLRAVAGLPLGSTALRGHAAMVNLVGALPAPASILAIDGAHLHLYGKEPRAGRKVGHVTVLVDDEAGRDARLAAVLRVVDAL